MFFFNSLISDIKLRGIRLWQYLLCNNRGDRVWSQESSGRGGSMWSNPATHATVLYTNEREIMRLSPSYVALRPIPPLVPSSFWFSPIFFLLLLPPFLLSPFSSPPPFLKLCLFWGGAVEGWEIAVQRINVVTVLQYNIYTVWSRADKPYLHVWVHGKHRKHESTPICIMQWVKLIVWFR